MAAVVGALFAPARVAAAEIYTWSSCNWSLVEHGSLPDYTYRSHNMPADGWGDGVKNSFVDRIADSVSRWNAALASAGRTGRLVPATTSDERISIYYQTISGVARGITAINLDLSPEFCVLNDGSGSDPVFSAQIYVTVLPYWFTQDDSRRSYWETRCPAGTGTPYTCGKIEDFGSTLTHEFAHALGVLHHPPNVNGAGSPAYTAAKCANIPSRASICASGGEQFRSERRTLEQYDLGNLGSTKTHWP